MLRFGSILSGLIITIVQCSGEVPPHEASVEDAAHIGPRQFGGAQQVVNGLHAQYSANTLAAISSSGGACTPDNIVVRKEWGNLSPSEKSDFISAVQCMNTSPGKSPPGLNTDASNRWDDFTVVHNINTPAIHWSGLMLPWHRRFLSEMERTLREECGYQGYLPYWEYPKYLDRPTTLNPLFDGSPTSIGGDGNGPNSCVMDGPFANFAVNMPPPDGSAFMQPNPRCIKRKFRPGLIEQYASYDILASALQNSADIIAFHYTLENPNGLHPYPHTYIGGLQNNIYLSPQDPWFFFHHCMIDRLWAIWQALDFGSRTFALDPYTYFQDRTRLQFGPLPEATLDTILYLSPIFENMTISEAMSPTDGGMCYMYD